MAITRRKFLQGFTIGAIALALNPLETLAIETPKISIDNYVDKIPGDRLSDSFYKDKNHGFQFTKK